MPFIYLLHYDRPLSGTKVQHVCGYAKTLKRRVEEHRGGRGSKLAAEFARQGIDFVVARTWNKDPWTGGSVTYKTEERFKNRRQRWDQQLNPETGELEPVLRSRSSMVPKRYCPICHPNNTRGNGAPMPPQFQREEKHERKQHPTLR